MLLVTGRLRYAKYMNMNIETETTLAYSLPIDVAQGLLLEDFCAIASNKNDPNITRMCVSTYRVTRIGDILWRIGKCRELDRSAVRQAATSASRLTLLRTLDDATLKSSYFSYLKVRLMNIDRAEYVRSWTFDDNIRYINVFRDTVGLEIDTGVMPKVERALIASENDVSDNNLGLNFLRRIFFDVRLSASTLVRVSLQSRLTEYHEIAYYLDVECEASTRGGNDDEMTSKRCNERRDAIVRICTHYIIPLFRKHWPDGLRYENASLFFFSHETLDDHSIISCTTTSVKNVTNDVQLLVNRTIETSSATARSTAAASSMSTIVIKRKYDGVRRYGMFVNEMLRSDSIAIEIGENSHLFSGPLIYQLERCDHDVSVITEVSYVVNHEVLADSGNSPLGRQFEKANCQAAMEQRTPLTAYLLLDDQSNRIDVWSNLLEAILVRKRTNQHLISLLRQVRARQRKEALFAARLIFHTILSNIMEKITHDRTLLDMLSNVRNMTAEQAFEHRLLVPISIRDSNLFLREMQQRWRCGNNNNTILSYPLIIEYESTLEWSVDKASYDKIVSTLTKVTSNESVAADGWLLHNSFFHDETRYEKIKLRHTIELSVARDMSHVCTSNGVYAVRRRAIDDGKQQSTIWSAVLLESSLTPMATTSTSKLAKSITFHDLPFVHPDMTNYYSIGEFVVEDDDNLQFVRWRNDKSIPDSDRKTLVVCRDSNYHRQNKTRGRRR